jgi:hypothetical protein
MMIVANCASHHPIALSIDNLPRAFLHPQARFTLAAAVR